MSLKFKVRGRVQRLRAVDATGGRIGYALRWLQEGIALLEADLHPGRPGRFAPYFGGSPEPSAQPYQRVGVALRGLVGTYMCGQRMGYLK